MACSACNDVGELISLKALVVEGGRSEMEMDSITILLWFSFVLAFIYFVTSAKKLLISGKLPPGPLGLPLVGSFFQLGNKPHESLAKLAKIHGPLMTVQLGFLTNIVVSSPAMAQEVLQTHDQPFSGRNVPDAMTLGGHPAFSIVWGPPNHHWRNLRKLCTTLMFTSESLNASGGIRVKQIKDLIDYIKKCAESGRAINIGQVVFSTVLNVMSNTIYSENSGDYTSESTQDFKAHICGGMEEAGKPNIADYFPFLKRFDPQGVRRRGFGHMLKVDGILYGILKERLELIEKNGSTSNDSNDLLDVLIHHTKQEGSELHPLHIRSLLGDLFIAGTDTSTATIEWAMTELLRNRELLAKAKLELKENIAKDKPVEESDIARLPYLQAIVKETLRLHPPVPLLLPHRAEVDVEVCGFRVPKHAQMQVNVWAIGRDPEVWVDPMCFRPERFLEADIDFKGRNFELLPFGSGRRMCPGLPFAYRTVHLILGSLLHSFSWELADGMKPMEIDMEERFGLTLQKAKPLRAVASLD